MASKDTSDETNFSQTVLKALDVLECIALAEQPLSAAEVAKLCDISRPTAYRLICTLAARGYVAQADATHYRLGIQALSLSQNVRVSPVGCIGWRNMLHCSSMGKAILAFLSESDRTDLLERLDLIVKTRNTITDRARLREHLDAVRAQKFATDDEESEEGIRCVGAPIFDRTGRVFAAISLSGPAYRLSLPRLVELSDLVVETATNISTRLGYVPQS